MGLIQNYDKCVICGKPREYIDVCLDCAATGGLYIYWNSRRANAHIVTAFAWISVFASWVALESGFSRSYWFLSFSVVCLSLMFFKHREMKEDEDKIFVLRMRGPNSKYRNIIDPNRKIREYDDIIDLLSRVKAK